MKKLLSILTILTTLFFFTGAQAQSSDNLKSAANNKQGSKQGKKDRKQMMKEMDLSKTQKKQMKEFKRSGKTSKEAIQNDKTLSTRERKEKLMQLRKEQQEKMGTILTPAQREKMSGKMMENGNKYPKPGKQKDPVVINPDNK